MKVGDETVDVPKNVAWPNEQLGRALGRLGRVFDRLQHAGHRRSDGNNSPPVPADRGDRIGRLGRQHELFGVHAMLREILRAYRQERARPHVKRD